LWWAVLCLHPGSHCSCFLRGTYCTKAAGHATRSLTKLHRRLTSAGDVYALPARLTTVNEQAQIATSTPLLLWLAYTSGCHPKTHSELTTASDEVSSANTFYSNPQVTLTLPFIHSCTLYIAVYSCSKERMMLEGLES
jgi:hypothetical protein